MNEYTKEEMILAVAMWDSDNTTRLSEQSEETTLAMLRKARKLIWWLEVLDHEIKPINGDTL